MREVTETIVSTLRENVKLVPKTNIRSQETPSNKSENLPSIGVFSREFTVEEFGVAGSEPERKEIHEEKFNGDGKVNEFTLSQKALRPLISVEHPSGEERREPDDYSVDYSVGKIIFRTPPTKGKGNVLVRYQGAMSTADVRSLQLNLKYLINVTAQENSQQDAITIETLRALVIAKEALERQGVAFKILSGRTGATDNGATLRQIECIAQTKLLVEMPVGLMEKIIVEKVE